MIRAFLFLLILSIVAISTVWIADQPGDVVITWLGYSASMTMPAFAGLLIIGYVVVYLAYVLLMFPVRLIRLLSKDRRKSRSSDFTSVRLAVQTEGAILAEDPQAAVVFVKKLENVLGSQRDRAALFRAQLSRMKGSVEGESPYLKLLTDPLTAPIGYRWLIDYNTEKDNLERALEFARKAISSDIKAPWVDRNLIDLLLQTNKLEEALAALDEAFKKNHVLLEEYKQLKVKLYMILFDRAATQDDKTAWLDKVLKITPLTPIISLKAARFYSKTHTTKALTIIEEAYAQQPDWDLYQFYASLLNTKDTVDFLKRIDKLVKNQPATALSARVKGDACYKAKLWGQAKHELIKYLETTDPDVYIANLMANIEKYLGNIEASEQWTRKATGTI
jgi:HemY protein